MGMVAEGVKPHVQGCWFCFTQKMIVILGFAAIGLVSLEQAFIEAVRGVLGHSWHHGLQAAEIFTGYWIAIFAISIIPNLIDKFHGLLDRIGL